MNSLRRDKTGGLEPEKVEAEIQKAKAFLDEVATLLDPSSGRHWLFGQERPTELDAHVLVFVARLRDVGRDSLVPEALKQYRESATAEPSWHAVMEGRSTMKGQK